MNRVGYVLTAMGLFFTSIIWGQSTITWSKKGNGSWSVAANWDLNRLPNEMDTVVIPYDSVVIQNNVNAVAHKIIVGSPDTSMAGLAVFNTGTLTINGSSTSIELINSNLFNDGLISLSGVSLYGILIDTNSTFQNQDSLYFIGNVAIQNNNHLTNTVTGKMEITAVTTAITNLDTFYNYGNVDIINSLIGMSQGSDASSYFENNGSFICSSDNTGIRIFYGLVSNYGSIQLENGVVGVDLSNDVDQAQFENLFEVSLKNIEEPVFIEDSSVLVNAGEILIQDCINDAIVNYGIVKNLPSGNIIVDHSNTMFQEAYIGHDNSSMENEGLFQIDSMKSGLDLKVGAKLNNSGTITMNKVKDCVENRGLFENDGGIIQIADAQRAFYNSSDGHFLNKNGGNLNIMNSENYAFQLWTFSHFENQAGSTIISTNSGQNPFNMLLSAVLINEGVFEIN